MKRIITILVLCIVALGCKKEEVATAMTLNGTSWETSLTPQQDAVIKFEKLEFTSSSEVSFYTTFSASKLMTAAGKAKLKYTVEDAGSSTPKIHITGNFNSMSGAAGLGSKADFTLTYVAVSSDGLPQLSIDGKRGYSKVVYN
ncbi:MAG: hypothetical protein WKF66_08975 [Pedobacter sp.]